MGKEMDMGIDTGHWHWIWAVGVAMAMRRALGSAIDGSRGCIPPALGAARTRSPPHAVLARQGMNVGFEMAQI